MPTLLLKLVGPMQSWGVTSMFDQRDTFREPSKSGIIGLICSSLGIDRWDYERQMPMYSLRMGVRHDRPGTLRYDFQTTACGRNDAIVRADGKLSAAGGVVSRRYYLADAAFLVGLESQDRNLLVTIGEGLNSPVWPLFLGRKSYVPSEPILCAGNPFEANLEDALLNFPLLRASKTDYKKMIVQLSLESSNNAGLVIMDQPVGALGQRWFSSRYLINKNMQIGEVDTCSSTGL